MAKRHPLGSHRRGAATVVGTVLLVGLVVVVATAVAATTGVGAAAPPVAADWTITATGPDTLTVGHGGGPTVDATGVVLRGPAIEAPVAVTVAGKARWSAGTTQTVERVPEPSATVAWLVWYGPGGTEILLARWGADEHRSEPI